jgi:hypothetical protein
MTESPVNRCIRKANAIKLTLAQTELAELPKYLWSNRNPLHGISLPDRITIKGVALTPLALVLLFILAFMTPFSYLGYLRELEGKRKELRERILGLKRHPVHLEAPRERTLRGLWAHYGLTDWRHPGIDLDLLCDWVDILYGAGRSAELGIRERVGELGRRNVEANRPYYERRPGAAHWYFGKPMDVVLEELSKELPPLPASDIEHQSRSSSGATPD